ncbi:MAG: UDP-GlcNAc:undecaprenyl-phosphate GlcNAc-1-phosphate transferase [Oceanicoccus sp.]
MNEITLGTPIFAAVALLAFVGSYIALCVFRPVAAVLKLLDVAGDLKHHQGAVPLVGGLAIMAGYLLALSIHPVFITANISFLVASSMLVIMGALDDRFMLSPLLRLVVQVIVALIAVFSAGLVVETIGAPFSAEAFEMGWFEIPVAILVIVGGVNAWNMIDGIDGLASVLAFIALAFLLAVSGPSTPALQASLLALMCGIGAFFLFNLPLRYLRLSRTFLGDAGSMFLGLAIVWHALALSQGEASVMSPITALWFVALPVYDVITTTLRRVLSGVSPLAGDRQHLHYLLQDCGLSTRQALAILSALALFGGAVGLLSHFSGVSDAWVFALFVLFGTAYFFGVRRLSKVVKDIAAAPLNTSSA